MRTWGWVIVGLGNVALLLSCDDAATSTCRGGTSVVADDHTYCAFPPDVVARGAADCPDALSFRISVGASIVCADRELSPVDVPSAVCDAIGGCGESPDAGPTDGGSTRDATPDAGADTDADTDAGALDSGADAAAPTRAILVVDGGEYHTCVLTSAGTVACWGSSRDGQRGVVEETSPIEPTLVPGLPDRAIGLACGRFHSCAVIGDGSVWCWGANGAGRSAPDFAGATTPVRRVVGVLDAVEVSLGDQHSCARLRSGGVSCWGDLDQSSGIREARVIGGIDDAVEIAAGLSHTCARRRSGRVSCWGSNVFGQLGAGSMESWSIEPLDVVGVVAAEALASGSAHSCASSGGTLVCWGSNDHASLGRMPPPSGESLRSPVPVADLTGVLAVAGGGPDLGGGHTCVRRALDVLCWGLNNRQQTGGPSTASHAAPWSLGLAAAALGLGGRHSCAIETSGRVLCWGDNSDGQLGVDLGGAFSTPIPQEVRGIP